MMKFACQLVAYHVAARTESRRYTCAFLRNYDKINSMIRVMHIITDLDIGGAENMLAQLLPMLSTAGCWQHIICLSDHGPLADTIQRQGYHVTCLNMKRGHPSLRAFLQLIQIIRRENPDILQSWLYHADLFAGWAGFFMRIPVVWGLHNATLNPQSSKITQWIVRFLSLLSHFLPRKIISCSETAQHFHEQKGYDGGKFLVIPNGFDTERFKPDAKVRAKTRAALHITPADFLIGNIARFDPQKNHETLIRALGLFSRSNPDARFVFAGKEIDRNNPHLKKWLTEAGIASKTQLLGIREDIPELLNGLDCFVLASVGEAFPLALGEAMSVGCLCVSTDVGDTKKLLGDCGLLVEDSPHDAEAIFQTLTKLTRFVRDETKAMRAAARERIIANFSLAHMADAYMKCYQSILFPNRKEG